MLRRPGAYEQAWQAAEITRWRRIDESSVDAFEAFRIFHGDTQSPPQFLVAGVRRKVQTIETGMYNIKMQRFVKVKA